MNNKHTPGFYQLELKRARDAYEDMGMALSNAQHLNSTTPDKAAPFLTQTENDYFSAINDYFIASENFIDSDNDIVQDAIYALDQQQQNIGLLQRIRNFFKTR